MTNETTMPKANENGDWMGSVKAFCATHGVEEIWAIRADTRHDAKTLITNAVTGLLDAGHDLDRISIRTSRVFEIPKDWNRDADADERRQLRDETLGAVYAQLEDWHIADQISILKEALDALEYAEVSR